MERAKHSFSIIIVLIFVLIYNGLQAQTISSFSPASGPVGTAVTISGTGFDATPANNVVFFGATTAAVNSAGTTSLTVNVPAGANYYYITVTNLSTNLTAYSSKPFIVTGACNDATYGSYSTIDGGSHNIEIVDMDGDGMPDLVIPNYFTDNICISRNTSTPGSISFATPNTFPWAGYPNGQPNEVSLGDFDGDGKPDVATGGNGGGTFVSVYRNMSVPGSIALGTRQDFAASNGQGNGNRVADIDGDGKPDLLSVHWSGDCLWVLRNISTGPGNINFAAGVSFPTTAQPHKIDVGDLDGDGKPDVVITAFTSNTMSVFRNTSTPGNISFAARHDYYPGAVPYFVHIGDLDGDGKADIAVVNRDVATLAIYRNTSTPGNITLSTRQDFATPAGASAHYGLALGDLNGDGKPDIAVGNYTFNATSIFLNTSTPGTISFATRIDVPSGVSYDAGIADFDGDNKPDIVVTNCGIAGNTISILPNICSSTGLPPVAAFQSDRTRICANDCVQFSDLSNNATAWHWSFDGGNPLTSIAQNPAVCYPSGGIYNVTLVAYNAAGTDTLTLTNYITVDTAPPVPAITQVHDTVLYCSTNAEYISYQWYKDSVKIDGATDTLLIISTAGNYNVEVTDAEGCKIAVGTNIILGQQNYRREEMLQLYPNPAGDQFTIHNSQFTIKEADIYNVFGQLVLQSAIDNSQSEISVSSLPSGIYFVQLTGDKRIAICRFIKQ